MQLIFKKNDDGTNRVTGAGKGLVSVSDSQLVSTSEEGLSDVFANASVDELAGTGDPIEAAVEDPLAYRDFLVLENKEIVFDAEYVRPSEGV